MTEITDIDPKELANRIIRMLERDRGQQMANFMGVEPSKIVKMTEDELIAFGRSIKLKEPTHCHECGQSLPQDA